jgi:uncharacterized protein YfaS (alpha-2-macroglobulin family)
MKGKSVLRKIIFNTLLLVFPLFLGSSNISDKSNERFFLSNYTTFSPGTKVTVNLYSSSRYSKTFNFRLLKVEDPIKFFTEIDKSALRNAFDIWGKDKEFLLKYSSLQKEWNETVSFQSGFYRQTNVDVGVISSPGIYILQALRGDLVAYCGIVVSDLGMVYKNSGKEVIAFVANTKTGKFITGSMFFFVDSSKIIETKKSDKEGIVLFETKKRSNDSGESMLLLAQADGEIVLSDPYFYFRGGEERKLLAYIYTNQPVYRPGQEVNFKAIIREKINGELKTIGRENFSISIKSPRNAEVYSSELSTNEIGTLSGSFMLDGEADLGNYTIQISKKQFNFYGSFSVEEYKKPEFYVMVEPAKSHYSRGDMLEAGISASYYFGSVLQNGKVTINIYKQSIWRPWWYWSDYAWFYRGFHHGKGIYSGSRQLIHQQYGELSDSGTFNFSYKVEDEHDADFIYIISAEVTDNSRRVVTGSSQVFVTRGSFTISTSPEKYFYEPGQTVRLRVNASDFSDKPVETKFKIIIEPTVKRNFPDSPLQKDTLTGRTDKFGRAMITYLPDSSIHGHFNYSVFAFDEKGREVSAKSSFFVGDIKYYYSTRARGIEIITDKDSYEKDDSLIAYIFLQVENTDLLLTYESENIIGYRKYRVKGNNFIIREKLTNKFSPSFNLSISFLKDRQFYTSSKLIGVLAKDKFLNISVKPDKSNYKPGEKAAYQFIVTDSKGKPAANAELSVGIVDESIYAIKEDQTPSIQNYFYAPAYSYIPTYSSLQYSNLSGSSRQATFLDKYYFSKKEREGRTGSGLFYGTIKPKGTMYLEGTFLFLSNDYDFYKTRLDHEGKFEFKNIVKGTYDVFITLREGFIKLDEDVRIDGRVYREFELDEEEIIIDESGGELQRALGLDLPSQKSGIFYQAESTDFDQRIAKKESVEYVQAETRTNFVDAPYWQAHLLTDNEGKAKIEFQMPDNLTTWRTTVRGVTQATDVGEQIDKVITRKELLVRMETPRFFREGDRLTISTIVHNYLDEKKKTKISFRAKNLKLVSSIIDSHKFAVLTKQDNFYEIFIEKNSEAKIDWIVEIIEPVGEAVLYAEALTNQESDAMELKIPIYPKGIRITNPITINLNNEPVSDQMSFNIPADADLRAVGFTFSLTPSFAGTVLKAIDDLVAYPYGCVEQTMSRFLPAVIVSNAFEEIGVPLKTSTIEKLPDIIETGLKRLYNFQHDDGGWGWWKNDGSNPFMTAYVIYGLSLTKESKIKVDENILNKGIEFLKKKIDTASDEDHVSLAFMLYSLSSALAGNTSKSSSYIDMIEVLTRKDLNSYATSLLALAALNFNANKTAVNLVDLLKEKVNESNRFAFWGTDEKHYYRWQNDKVQSTAFALKALIQVEPNSPLVTKAANWLITQKQGYSWRSTQETATVIFALTDYLKSTDELNPDYKAEVYLNNKKIFEKNFSREDIYTNIQTIKLRDINPSLLKRGENQVRIVKAGEGRLYFSGLNTFYTLDKKIADQYRSFNIKREYYILQAAESSGRFLYLKKKFNGEVISGQDILVKTFVEVPDGGMQYFILEDMLPSGFEVVKDEQNYEIEGEHNYQPFEYRYYPSWRWFYADKEYRDEKVAFFVTNTSSSMEFSYIMKAQIPGNYTVMPSQGSLMYYPEIAGYSDMMEISVKDLE